MVQVILSLPKNQYKVLSQRKYPVLCIGRIYHEIINNSYDVLNSAFLYPLLIRCEKFPSTLNSRKFASILKYIPLCPGVLMSA